MVKSRVKKKKDYSTTKNTMKKGCDPGIITEAMKKDEFKLLSSEERKKFVVSYYNEHFGRTSKETRKANLRELIMQKNQVRRFIALLKQDGNKVDIIAANYDEANDVILITISQQKGNDASFNTSSEEKTLEKIFGLIESENCEYFNMLPDELNPLKCGKHYKLDFIIGMVNACGEKEVTHNKGYRIKYLSNKEYLLYLGLDITPVQLAVQISNHENILNHQYDAVSECCNFDQVYKDCLKELNYDRDK